MATPTLLALPDLEFQRVWGAMAIEERNALPDEVRTAAVERKRMLTPEITESVKRATAARGQNTKQSSAPDLVSLGFWIAAACVMLDVPYVLKGIIGPGQVIVFWGAPGSGKTFITIELLCAIGSGQAWHGRRTRRGVVVYLVAESSRLYIENRIAAMRGASPALANADVFVIPLALDLRRGTGGERLIEAVKFLSREIGAVTLIAVDTLAKTFGGGDENNSVDMGTYIGSVQHIAVETNAAVLLLHHCGKNEAAGMRGHSALLGALDAEITIEAGPDGHRILRTGKVRDGEAYQDLFAFTLRRVELGMDQDGDPLTSCVVDGTDDMGTQEARRRQGNKSLGRHQRRALELLEAAGGRMSRADLLAKLRDGGATRTNAYGILARMLDSGVAVAHNGVTAEVCLP